MTLEHLLSRRVGVLGFGQEGQAITNYLLRHGIKPVLFDKRPAERFSTAEQALWRENELQTHLGEDYLDHLTDIDVAFRSPGIWRLQPELLTAEKRGTVITSQAIWFFEQTPTAIIGVTGTKGKGTTASLIAHLLQAAGRQVYLTGNVGQVQPLDILDELSAADLIVYELSSFQLQDLTQSPHIAVVLMVTEDHLDVHASSEEYRQAKTAITKFQTAGDVTIVNDDYPISQDIGSLGAGRKLRFSRHHPVADGAYVKDGQLIIAGQGRDSNHFDLAQLPLRGQHNWDNGAAAILAALQAGVTAEIIINALPTFQTLPHRLQQLPEQNGVQFFDDSISTVPDTAAAAIASFTEPVLVLIGGYDKGLDPTPLLQALLQASHLKAVTAIGATGPRLGEQLKAQGFTKPILEGFSDLKSALRATKALTQAGDVVLLSPGYASFGWYDNYKQRGEHFAQLVGEWGQL